MRDREYAETKPSGTYRVLVLGDSVTFGDGMAVAEVYSKVAERLWNARHPALPVEIMNTGVRGYNTFQEYQTLKEVGDRVHPDWLVLGYVLNDAEPLAKQAGLIDPRFGVLIVIKNWVRDHSYLYAFLRRYMVLVRQRTQTAGRAESYEDQFEDGHEGWKASEDALAGIRDWAAARHIPLTVLILPRFETLESSAEYRWQAIHQKISAAAVRLGVECVDLLSAFRGSAPGEFMITPTDSFHPNAAGHRRIADALVRLLDRRLTAAP